MRSTPWQGSPYGEHFRQIVSPLEQLIHVSSLVVRGDRRLHFAHTVLEAWTKPGHTPLTPTELLALAVVMRVETPRPRESQQEALYEAWKKRHAGVMRRLRRVDSGKRRA